MTTDYTQVPVIQCTYQLSLSTQQLVPNLPKSSRFILGDRLVTKTLTLFESVCRANFIRDHKSRVALLHTLSAELFTLNMLFRMAKDLKHLPYAQHAATVLRLDDIGKQLTAWRKWSESQLARS